MASQDCAFVTTLWNGRLPKQELLLNPEILLREDYDKFDRNELIFFFFFLVVKTCQIWSWNNIFDLWWQRAWKLGVLWESVKNLPEVRIRWLMRDHYSWDNTGPKIVWQSYIHITFVFFVRDVFGWFTHFRFCSEMAGEKGVVNSR